MNMVELDPTVEEHVRYLARRVSDSNRGMLDRRLATSDGARARHIEVLRHMDALQALSPEILAQRANQSDLEGETARALVKLASETLAARVREILQQGLGPVLSLAREGAREGQAALAASREFFEQLLIGLRQPQFSLTRGTDLPAGEVELEVAADGSLQIRASGSGWQDGQTLELFLQNGDLLPLGKAEVKSGRIDWRAADIGRKMNLPVGLLPPELLRIQLADQPVSVDETREILAEVQTTDRRYGEKQITPIEIIGRPAIRGGEMFVNIRVPEHTLAQSRSQTLFLDLGVSESVRLFLGSWPLADWDSQQRTLVIPFPLDSDDELPFVSLLRARLS